MKRKIWRKHHKWIGILFCFFLLMFCISGVLLNHRAEISGLDISRSYLPREYHYEQWNNGLFRGSISCSASSDSIRSVLVFGNGGIWKTDSSASHFKDFNHGLPDGADCKAIRNVIQTSDGELFMVNTFNAFRYDFNRACWTRLKLPLEERLCDVTHRGDSVVVLGRSHLFVARAPYDRFEVVTLKEPDGYRNEISLFRTVWSLHSGEMFGTIGRLAVDLIAIFLVFLCVTGIMCWLLPKMIRRIHSNKGDASAFRNAFSWNFKWHDLVGRKTIICTLFICMTGWFLRPPLMIPLAVTKVMPIPYSEFDNSNPFHDRLRMLRYDEERGDWLLSSSEGFFSLSELDSIPKVLSSQPPVSVMGVNVLQKDSCGEWLVGSFAGLFRWNRTSNQILDYFTNKPVVDQKGMPLGSHIISGYSDDFTIGPFPVDYSTGTDKLIQPEDFKRLRMSLWNLSLEIHTGRIFTFLGPITLIFVFLSGCLAIWCLISGWKIRK